MEHYDRQLAQNIAKIAETYESLERTELWTDTDKIQLEEEIHSILEPKEKQLKEEKQKKLETARNNKTKEQVPLRGTKTYADVLKIHIRAKLDPPKSNNNTTKLLRPREPQSEKQRTSQKGNKELRDYRPPQTQESNRETRRTERTWYNQRDRQPRYRQQQEGRRQQPQGRYFLTRGQFSRNRYKN